MPSYFKKSNLQSTSLTTSYKFVSRIFNRLIILPLTLPLCLVLVLGVGNVLGQQFWKTDGTSATWTGANWGTSSSGPFTTAWSSGSATRFTANSTVTFATATVGNITLDPNITVTVTSAGTLTTTAARTFDIGTGSTLTWTGQSWSASASSAGFIKNGAGTWNIGAQGNTLNATNFGFTLNAGTVILSGANSFGNTNCVLSINGGTIQTSGSRAFANSTLNIGGNFIFTGTGNDTYSGTVGLGAATRTITNSTTSGSRIFSGVISGTSGSGLTFDGSGAGQIYIGNTANTFTGTISINGGEVGFALAGSYGNVNNTIVINGGRLSAATTAGAAASYTLASTHGIQVGSTVGTSISPVSGGTLTYDGIITNLSGNTGILTKQGSGTLSLGGVSTYTGATTINNGTILLTTGNDRLPTGTVLSLGQSASTNLGTFNLNGRNQTIAGLNSTSGTNASASKNTITSTASATLTVSGSGTYGDGTNANSGIISGAISLVKSGTGTLTLGDVNTYTGTTTVSGGTLQLAGGNAGSVGAITSSPIGTSTLNLNGGTLSSNNTTARTILNSTSLGGNVTLGDATNTGALSFDAATTISGATRTLTAASAVTFTGAIGDGGNAFGITKAGAGSITLSGANTYTGATTINAGTLTLSGSASIANSSAITVGSGGTFDVSGLTTALSLGASQSLKSSATGANTTATITVASSKGITLSAGGLQFTAYGGGATAPLTVTGASAGSLALASSPITVTTTSELAAGTYKLIAKGGSVTAAVSGTIGTLTMGGSGLASNTTGALSIVNGELILTVTATPILTAATLTSAISNVYGTASTGVSFTASGSNLTSNITATAQTGFAVSTSLGSGYTTSVSVASGTTVYVQSTATKAVSAFNSTTAVVLSEGGAASSVNITTSASGNAVTQKALTISSAAATNKTYDRTTTATITGSLSGVVNSDVVTLSGTGTFAQSNIGTAISVTSTSTLGGAGAGNYSLTQPTGLTANITAKALTVSGASASNKTYDGANTATVTGGSLVGIVSPDAVTLSQSGTFAQTTIGSTLSVTSTSTLGGADAGNYTLTQPTGLTANITAKALTVSGMTAADKTYDGTTTATLSGGSLVGIVSADVVTLTQTGTFSQSTVGYGLTVTSTSSLGGANAASYSLTQPSGITASITKATPVINSSPSASDITLGQALSSSTLTGGSATPSGGSFAFTSPSTVPGSTGSYSAGITYTPADITNYNTVSSTTAVLVNAAVSPTINAVSLSSSLSSTYGTASTGISFTPSGSNLSANITVTAQPGFEVSTSLGSGYGASVSVASGSTVYVHFSASIAAGSYNNTVFAVLSSAGATNTDAITSASSNSVSQKIVSISTASIASKTYDASATSGTVTAGTLSGFVGAETVTISAVTGTYPDANIGTGKTATIVYTLANGTNGGLATNYSLANTSATGDITTKALSISAATIASKVYDASATSGTITAGTLSGFVGSETVTILSTSGIYTDANVGTGKTATISYTLTNGSNGGLATNYTLSNTSSTGNITAKSLSISAASIASKTYDASATSGTVTPGALSGFVGSETVSVSAAVGTYADGNAGTGKSATIVYTLADGANGGLATNYTLANTVGTGNITKLPLTITAADQSVAYATSVAAVTGAGSYTASGFVNGETSSVIGGSATYSTTYTTTTAVGSIGVTITPIVSSLTATNYSFTAATGTVTVSIANQTITALTTPVTKILSDVPYSVATTATSGLTVTYSSSNLSVATVAANGTVTIQGLGTATITASQAGDGNYNAATSVTQALTVNPNPSISATPSSLAAFTADAGTASTPQGFTVTGSNLIADITVTAPTGFEVSQTVGGGSGYAATQTLTQVSGAVSKVVYVRMTASATGTPSGNVAMTSTSASTVNVAVSGAVNSQCSTAATIFSENMGSPSGTTAIASNTFQNSSPITFSGSGDVRSTTGSSGYSGSSAGGNVLISNTNFVISGINTTGYTSLALSLGHYKSTTASNNELVVEVSSDGSSYSALTYSRATGTGTASWLLVSPTGTIPATSNLRIRFSNTTTSPQFRIDDVVLTGIPACVPAISTGGGPLSSLSTTYGTPSSPTSFELTGSNLSTTISIAALSGFEFSSTAGGAGAYTSTLSGISATGPTTIYVRLAASANVNTYSGNIVCSSGSTTLNVPMVSSTVSKANQTITFASTNSKTFGDANYAPGATSASSGAIPITYASSNTSVATIVSSQINIVGVGSSTITASQAGNSNYNAAADVTQTLTVVKANQSITFASTNTKTYGDADYAPGATSATSGTNAITYASSNASVATIVSGQIHVVGPGTTTITASQSGNTNYNAAADATQTLTVNPKALTITNLTANSKNEDGNTNATLTGTAALSGVVLGDDVSLSGTAVGTFASAAVGVNINVTVSSLSLIGTSASNYSLTTLILTADIIANSPTLFSSGTLSAVNTTYGSASPSPSSFSVSAQSLTDPVTITPPSGFEVSTTISSGYSSSINVGTSGTLASTTIYVRLTDATTFAGSPYSGNIVLSSNGATSVNVATASSAVSQKNLTITGMTTANKVYNGTNTAIVTGGSLVGIIGSDVVTLTQSGTFAQTSVGTNIAITSTSTIGGAASGNYILTQPSLTSRDITAKALSITTATIASKVYDGTTTSGTVTAGTLSGFVGSETVVVSSATGAYSDANVGTGKTATITYTLGNGTNGGLSTNYSIANTTATGDITLKSLTITATDVSKEMGVLLTGGAGSTAFTSSGLAASETIGSVTITYGAAAGTTGQGATFGTYSGQVTPSAATGGTFNAANYSITYSSGSITVSGFTAGNIVVERIGNGSTTLTSAASSINVLELNTSGTTQQTLSTLFTGTNLLTESGTGTSNGNLNSYNTLLGVPGYNLPLITAGVSSSNTKATNILGTGATVVNRVVFPTSGSPLPFTGDNFRSIIPTSSTTFYASGAGSSSTGGIWYFNGTSYTQVSITQTNTRNVEIFNGNLYYSTGSGTTGIYQVGTGLPTSSGQTATIVVAAASPYGFSVSPDGNTMYIADDGAINGNTGGGIQKWTKSGSTWTRQYTFAVQARGLTVDYSNTNAVIYATTITAGANKIVKIIDSGSSAASSDVILAGSNYVFRGVDFAPAAAPSAPTIGTVTQTTCSTSTGSVELTGLPSGQWRIYGFPSGSAVGTGSSTTISDLAAGTYTFIVTSYSGRTSVASASATINTQPGAPGYPTAPTASAQSFCTSASPTVGDLTVTTGSSIKWYDTSTNGNLLSSATSLSSGNYYASQTVSGCESTTRTSVAVTINSSGTWIGDSNDDWNNANNWCGGIPNSNSIVVSIPSGVTVNLDTSPSVSELTIASTSVINAGSNTITIANGGSFTNNGTFNAQTGTVAFSGTGTVAGNATTFSNLTTSGNLTISASPTISGTLTLSSGTLTVGANTLTVNGSISTTSGNIDASNASATVVFGGSTAQTIPASTFTGNINNLTLNNSAGLTTSQSLTVANTLNLSSGVLTLGTNNLTLTGSLHASNNGSSTAFINTNSSGAFIRSISSTGVDYKFPVGLSDYAPISVNFTGGTIASSTLASRAVSGLHPEAEDGAYIRSNLYWQMNQSGMTNPQYNVSFTYPGVTNGVGSSETEANLLPAKWSASTGWLSSGSCAVCYSGTTMGTSSINTGTKTLTWNGVTGFSDFGGFGEGNGSPLPVELLSFSGNCENDQTQLTWKTASENNSDYFELLKSQDGENWRVINTQAAAGFSTTLQTYSYTELEKSNEAYYRLNQVDINGNFKLYDPIYIDCNESDNKFETYPNPSSNGFNIALNDSKLKGEAVIIIRDAMGKVIFEKSIFVEEGINLYPVASIELENGVYFITIEGKQAQSKLIKHIKN